MHVCDPRTIQINSDFFPQKVSEKMHKEQYTKPFKAFLRVEHTFIKSKIKFIKKNITLNLHIYNNDNPNLHII